MKPNKIAQNLKQNKRADTIVKGTLQRSRRSSVQKEPTEINALVDEYLRLANHGQWQKTNRSMQ